MNCTSRTLLTGCLLLLASLPVKAADNSLLVPVTGSCLLAVPHEQQQAAVSACQEFARNGDMEAQFELGTFYYQGEYQGEKHTRDPSQALYWFEQASLKGHAQAQYFLGLMFYHGDGVPENYVQAYILFKMASVNGSDDAVDAADQVYEQMSQGQVEIASQVLGEIFRDYLMEMQGLQQSTQPGLVSEPPFK